MKLLLMIVFLCINDGSTPTKMACKESAKAEVKPAVPFVPLLIF